MRTARRPADAPDRTGTRPGRFLPVAVACLAVLGPTACTASGAVPSSAAPSAPSRPAAATVATEPLVVVLDPGHNGRNAAEQPTIWRRVPDGRGGEKPCNTTGTATATGYPEHAFNFDVATRVAAHLTAAGVRVVLTRPDDTGVGPCVDERGRAGAAADADAVVSVHADGAAPRSSGFHVALSAPPVHDAQGTRATALGTALRDALRGAGFPVADYLGTDGLSSRSDLAGLNLATRPTALVECGNMRNPAEAALMSTPEGRERYAAAIAAGTLTFLDH